MSSGLLRWEILESAEQVLQTEVARLQTTFSQHLREYEAPSYGHCGLLKLQLRVILGLPTRVCDCMRLFAAEIAGGFVPTPT